MSQNAQLRHNHLLSKSLEVDGPGGAKAAHNTESERLGTAQQTIGEERSVRPKHAHVKTDVSYSPKGGCGQLAESECHSRQTSTIEDESSGLDDALFLSTYRSGGGPYAGDPLTRHEPTAVQLAS